MHLSELLHPGHVPSHGEHLPDDADALATPAYPGDAEVFEDVADVVYGSAPIHGPR